METLQAVASELWKLLGTRRSTPTWIPSSGTRCKGRAGASPRSRSSAAAHDGAQGAATARPSHASPNAGSSSSRHPQASRSGRAVLG